MPERDRDAEAGNPVDDIDSSRRSIGRAHEARARNRPDPWFSTLTSPSTKTRRTLRSSPTRTEGQSFTRSPRRPSSRGLSRSGKRQDSSASQVTLYGSEGEGQRHSDSFAELTSGGSHPGTLGLRLAAALQRARGHFRAAAVAHRRAVVSHVLLRLSTRDSPQNPLESLDGWSS